MTVYYSDDQVTVHHGDALDVLAGMPDASVDAVVTDPPYALGFMGKEWDKIGDTGRGARARVERSAEVTPIGRGHSTSGGAYLAAGVDSLRSAGQPFQQWCEQWAVECLRLLKPGGYLLAFGGSRTFHRLACAIEDAGFEIRDTISWLYGSGFPKSMDVSKAIDKAETAPNDDARRWQGWGTALKPAWEPVIVARKPLAGTVAANVLAHGTGALNIDGCRVEVSPADLAEMQGRSGARTSGDLFSTRGDGESWEPTSAGRWPANVVLDEDAAAQLDQQSGETSSTRIEKPAAPTPDDRTAYGDMGAARPARGFTDTGGASRFYYTAKAAPDERPRVNGISHPTIKPLELMRWLVRLVTPPGGLVLDPFAGSGTTGEACLIEGFRCVLIEREADYLPLIKTRLSKPIQPTLGATS